MSVAAVAIARNEGERLHRCLLSLRGVPTVYVDSGSTDGSVELARSMGVAVVELDTSVPFTAARARNAGFAALPGSPELVQFVDGDCAVEPGWLDAAAAAMSADPTLGLVTGWRTERDPARNVFHAMAEHEWHRPPGEIDMCGGDMMVRADAFREVGGFDPGLIAGEDGEFCLRLHALTGLRLVRLPRIMTRHDVSMSRTAEWWRRQVRSGHAYAEVAAMRPPVFRREVLRGWALGLVVPLVGLAGLALAPWWPAALLVASGALLLLGVSGANAWRGLRREGLPGAEAARQAPWLLLSKAANLQGILTYHVRRLRGARRELIEYK